MQDDWEFELALYTPRQAEKATGISMVRQRDLRRHGYLPKQDGVAAFTVIDLAKMAVLSSMMQHGMGPARSNLLAEASTVAIVACALSDPAAWEGMDLAHWTAPGEQKPKDKAEWLVRQFCMKLARQGDLNWRMPPARFFVIFADGREFWTNSLDRELGAIELSDPRVGGPLLVLDLMAMAASLRAKADLPLARVVPAAE